MILFLLQYKNNQLSYWKKGIKTKKMQFEEFDAYTATHTVLQAFPSFKN